MEYLRCVRCHKKLELEILNQGTEISEGFLLCGNCNLQYPIINKIPILWDDFSAYLSSRSKLGGKFLLHSKSTKMKSFVKKSLSKVRKDEDRTDLENRWCRIYQNSTRSKFYSVVKSHLKKIPKQKIVLEHGCSIGTMSEYLARNNKLAFGIDKSYSAIAIAKKTRRKNLDYFVADSVSHPFGTQKFGLILGLNLLELIEPKKLVSVLSNQIYKGYLMISDPYDFDRGKHSVVNQFDAKSIRKEIEKHRFRIIKNTKKPSFIPWTLNLTPRTKLNYQVDLVVCKKSID